MSKVVTVQYLAGANKRTVEAVQFNITEEEAVGIGKLFELLNDYRLPLSDIRSMFLADEAE